MCIVLRLARFNALLDDDTRPAYTREYFTGMPAPCGAVGAIGPLAAMLQFGTGLVDVTVVRLRWLAANAALLVSRVPTLALKSVSVPPNAAPILLILVAGAAAATAAVPLRPGAADHRRLPLHHPVRHAQPALGGGAARDLGRQTPAAPRGPPRDPPRPAPHRPLGGAARVCAGRAAEQ